MNRVDQMIFLLQISGPKYCNSKAIYYQSNLSLTQASTHTYSIIMTTDYNEIVIPLVVSKVMKFLGFKESMKGIGSVNKTHRQILIEGTIIMNKTREGRLDELSGSILSCILNAGRLYPFVGQLVDDNPKEFSVKATSHLMKTYDTRGLKGLGFRIEEARLNASMYTYWKRTPQSKTDGSLNYIRENVTKLHSISQDQVETAVDRDVKYWRESRVFDTFGVLLERSDGTIVISQDLRRVYLVLGISTSLGSVFQQQSKLPFRYDSNRTQLASSLCKRLLFASATMTLVPWEGGIVFDGIAVGKLIITQYSI